MQDRRGTATVEFALMAPLFIGLLLGMIEMGRALNVSNQLTAALRDAGRLATMDYTENVPAGMTVNQKVIQDIRNIMTAAGFPGDQFEITVTFADGPQEGQPFDFADPENQLQLFKIAAEVQYDDVALLTPKMMNNRKISSEVVFRMGRTTLSG